MKKKTKSSGGKLEMRCARWFASYLNINGAVLDDVGLRYARLIAVAVNTLPVPDGHLQRRDEAQRAGEKRSSLVKLKLHLVYVVGPNKVV
jgi:hypothetical protein